MVTFYATESLRFGLVGAGLEVQSSFSKYFEKLAQMHMLCTELEQVCCKKRQKIAPDQLPVCGVGGTLKDPKDSKVIPNESKVFP